MSKQSAALSFCSSTSFYTCNLQLYSFGDPPCLKSNSSFNSIPYNPKYSSRKSTSNTPYLCLYRARLAFQSSNRSTLLYIASTSASTSASDTKSTNLSQHNNGFSLVLLLLLLRPSQPIPPRSLHSVRNTSLRTLHRTEGLRQHEPALPLSQL